MKQRRSKGMTANQIKESIYGKTRTPKEITRGKPVNKPHRPERAIRKTQKHDVGLILNLPYSNNYATEYLTPDWFSYSKRADISVIVPLYKTPLDSFVDSWDLSCEGARVELIFVDDNCPWRSKERVAASWESRKSEISNPIGRVFYTQTTQGWGACCNIGAERATGRTLVFMHPSGKLFPGWASSFLRALNKKDVGIVGGLHVDEVQDSVLNAGREWNWKMGRFAEIGFEIFNGKAISNPFHMNNVPTSIFSSGEREAVNGTFMAVKKSDFLEWGGFSPCLTCQSWSSADLCLLVKERRKKVIYEPSARIYLPSSNRSETDDRHDTVYFHNKWITSRRIDGLVKAQREEQPSEIRTILVRRQGGPSDVLIASAIAPALRKKYPESRIVFATNSPDVLYGNPWIDQVLEEYSERQFDLFLNLDMSYEFRPNTNILTAYAESAGVDVSDCRINIQTEAIDTPNKYITINAVNSRWVGRDWDKDSFDKISEQISERGYQVVCIGKSNDYKTSHCDIDLRGKTNLQQLAHVISKSTLCVGVSSLASTMAQVLGKPSVTFFGSINPNTKKLSNSLIPVLADGLKCLGCHHRKSAPCVTTSICETNLEECKTAISVDRMWKTIERALEKTANIDT